MCFDNFTFHRLSCHTASPPPVLHHSFTPPLLLPIPLGEFNLVLLLNEGLQEPRREEGVCVCACVSVALPFGSEASSLTWCGERPLGFAVLSHRLISMGKAGDYT